jgi:hypothetical protein
MRSNRLMKGIYAVALGMLLFLPIVSVYGQYPQYPQDWRIEQRRQQERRERRQERRQDRREARRVGRGGNTTTGVAHSSFVRPL